MTLFELDFFIFMLILMLVVGGLLVVVSSFGFAKAKNEEQGQAISQKLGVLESSVTEADEAISELNDMSKTVFKEFENKYQELLFLYNLIDEKEKRIGQGGSPSAMPEPANLAARAGHAYDQARGLEEYAKRIDIIVDDGKKMDINPKFANVLDLHRKGKSIEEIAKQLDMGKGEISLILTLGGGAKNA